MLKVKCLTLFKAKNEKKAGIFTKVAQKSSSARFFFNQVSRFSLIVIKIWFSIEYK